MDFSNKLDLPHFWQWVISGWNTEVKGTLMQIWKSPYNKLVFM